MEKNTFMFNLDVGQIVKESKDRWPRLLDEINKGNVIPVIGPDLLVENKISDNGDGCIENLHQQIISFIASQTNVKSNPRTFSQLVYDENYLSNPEDANGSKINVHIKDKLRSTYRMIKQIIDNLGRVPGINHEPSQLLMDLLGTQKFPFVITTSFTPIVEQAMEKIWGKGNVKIVNFTNDPKACFFSKGGDIQDEEDLKRPTLLYMLGKYCDNPEKYVVTDSDMMIYCGSWIKGFGVPKNLVEAMKKKYLLFLGNSYSDWLYRFVWFALRTTPKEMRSDYVVNEEAEESFKQFLQRLEMFIQENPSQAIQRIKEEMAKRGNTISTPTPTIATEYDVFISYSRRDEHIAWNLYNALKGKNKDINVWLDRIMIKTGEWRDAIKEGIKHTRLFVPILTKNIVEEALGVHEYRWEWNIAVELSQKMGGRAFIIPFAENGFDFNNPIVKLPNEFKKMNAIGFSDENEVQKMTDIIIEELKKLKEMEKNLKH